MMYCKSRNAKIWDTFQSGTLEKILLQCGMPLTPAPRAAWEKKWLKEQMFPRDSDASLEGSGEGRAQTSSQASQ